MIRRPLLLAGALLAIALLAADTAFGQLPRNLRIPSAVSDLNLLNDPTVQKELNLTAAQIDVCAEVASAMMSETMSVMAGLGDLLGNPEELEKEAPKISKTVEDKGKELQAKVDKVLDEKQIKRARQLALQKRGPEALEDETVVKELKITDDQKKKLVDIREGMFDERMQLVQEMFTGGDRDAITTKLGNLQKDADKKAMDVLTAEQKTSWEALLGAKFEFPPGGGLFGF